MTRQRSSSGVGGDGATTAGKVGRRDGLPIGREEEEEEQEVWGNTMDTTEREEVGIAEGDDKEWAFWVSIRVLRGSALVLSALLLRLSLASPRCDAVCRVKSELRRRLSILGLIWKQKE